jgi:hypothetical protein
MKPFRKYLMESARTYKYKIRLAGEPSKNLIQLFCTNLQKYDPVSISDPKSTPVQKAPHGFPGLKDQSVTIIDAEFKYPATEAMIKQLARLLGHDENLVKVDTSDSVDSFNTEYEDIANRASPLLTEPELEEQPGAKEASKEYGQSYLERVRKYRGDDKADTGYTGKVEKSGFDPLAPKSETSKSPMSSINRPARPATGARK